MEAPAEHLTDGVVTLRRWQPSDATALAAVAGPAAARLAEFLPWACDGYGHAEAVTFLARSTENWQDGATHDFAVHASDGALAGCCGLIVAEDHCEIGYWMGDAHLGRGLITRAAALLTAEAFRLGAPWVEIHHDVANVRSAAVPERLGFTRVADIPAEGPQGTLGTGRHGVWRKTRE